jgi:hypothetical protein
MTGTLAIGVGGGLKWGCRVLQKIMSVHTETLRWASCLPFCAAGTA